MNSGFLITDAGLAVATAAAPGGPYIHIATFKVAAGVNYTPVRSQTDVQGTVLYTGVPQSYTVLAGDISQVLLLMDTTVGSFDFGEVGLYLEDGTLFAICVWDSLQGKVKAVGSQFGNTWKIKSLLKLAQAPAIVQVDVVNGQSILEVPSWELLATPTDQPNGANVVIVHADDDSGNPVLVVRDQDTEWGVVGYTKLFTGATTDGGASSTVDTFTHPDLADLALTMPSISSEFLVKFADGQIRKLVDKPTSTSVQWSTALAGAPTGAIAVWRKSDIPSATTEIQGKVELATDAEAIAMVRDDVVLTPSNLSPILSNIGELEMASAGEICYFARSTPPVGFLEANGSAVSRTTYSDLFAAIGTFWGAGDGINTFNLPDLRGEFARGWDNGRGVDSGRAFGTTQADAFESHHHESLWTLYDGGAGQGLVDPVNPINVTTEGQTGGNIAYGTTFAGGTETRPRNIALLACIRYVDTNAGVSVVPGAQGSPGPTGPAGSNGTNGTDGTLTRGWVNMSGSRFLGTPYTNDTGNEIVIHVMASISNPGAFGAGISSVVTEGLTINQGSAVAYSTPSGDDTIVTYIVAHMEIKDGETYQVNVGSGSLAAWWEMRNP